MDSENKIRWNKLEYVGIRWKLHVPTGLFKKIKSGKRCKKVETSGIR
jgi:hypothetical protein